MGEEGEAAVVTEFIFHIFVVSLVCRRQTRFRIQRGLLIVVISYILGSSYVILSGGRFTITEDLLILEMWKKQSCDPEVNLLGSLGAEVSVVSSNVRVGNFGTTRFVRMLDCDEKE